MENCPRSPIQTLITYINIWDWKKWKDWHFWLGNIWVSMFFGIRNLEKIIFIVPPIHFFIQTFMEIENLGEFLGYIFPFLFIPHDALRFCTSAMKPKEKKSVARNMDVLHSLARGDKKTEHVTRLGARVRHLLLLHRFFTLLDNNGRASDG